MALFSDTRTTSDTALSLAMTHGVSAIAAVAAGGNRQDPGADTIFALVTRCLR